MKRGPPDKTGPVRKGLQRKAWGEKGPARPSAQRSGGLQRKVVDAKALASRAALNALKRAQRVADRAGVDLSEWEGEFLGSVAQRITTYGRAFADPDKGAPGQALSVRQGVKLKEIVAKAKGKPRQGMRRGGKGRTPLGKSSDPD